jgi:hypothetical protein
VTSRNLEDFQQPDREKRKKKSLTNKQTNKHRRKEQKHSLIGVYKALGQKQISPTNKTT